MSLVLRVTGAFSPYAVGDTITDPETIAAVLASPQAGFVVRVDDGSGNGSGNGSGGGGVVTPPPVTVSLTDTVLLVGDTGQKIVNLQTLAQPINAPVLAALTGAIQDTLTALIPIDPSNSGFAAALSGVLLAFLNGLPTTQPASAGWWNNAGQITYYNGA
jgi:hypothetical protein